jgi:hypothetical protein
LPLDSKYFSSIFAVEESRESQTLRESPKVIEPSKPPCAPVVHADYRGQKPALQEFEVSHYFQTENEEAATLKA